MPPTGLPAGLVFALMLGGVLLAAAGHLLGRRVVVTAGILLMFAATMLLFYAAWHTYDDKGRPPAPFTF